MRFRFLPLLAVAGVFGAGVVWARTSGAPFWLSASRVSTDPDPIPVARAPYDPTLVHKNLEFSASQARTDPGNAIFAAQLAAGYLDSYRETGDSADATRAEQAARASLAIRTNRNGDALFQLSRALLTQHRFAEALKYARFASTKDPVGLRQCADIEMELGDYQAAARDIEACKAIARADALQLAALPNNVHADKPEDDPAFLSLEARLNELHGDSVGQLRLLSQATKLADANMDMPVESIAWFHERLGRCLSMMGRLDEAHASYLVGLKAFPRDYRTLAALAHLEAARGNWPKTIEWGTRAARIVPSPETLALLGDANAALGQQSRAASQYRLVEQIGGLARAQGVLYDRQLALFYADHGRHLSDAVTIARGELAARHDIYAYDTLAWTLFKANRLEEAASNAKRATQFGTRDASLWFHAGEIAAAQGQKVLARTYLERALAINPQFHPSQPQAARATLAQLK